MSSFLPNLKLVALELQAKLLDQLDDFNVTELECVQYVDAANRDLHGDLSGNVAVKLSIGPAPDKFSGKRDDPIMRWTTKPHTIEVYHGPVVLTDKPVRFSVANGSKQTGIETNMLYSGIFFHDRLSKPGEIMLNAVNGKIPTLVACTYGVDPESISTFVEHYVKNWGW